MRLHLLTAAILLATTTGCADAINEANPNTLLSVTQHPHEDCQHDWAQLKAGQTVTIQLEKDGGLWAGATLQVDQNATTVLNATAERSQDQATATGTVPYSTEYMLSVCATDQATATLRTSS